MTLTWQAIGVIAGLVVHGFCVIWWASKITSRMDNVKDALIFLNKELEKRDTQLSAAWKKIDGLNTRLTRVETKVQICKPEEE